MDNHEMMDAARKLTCAIGNQLDLDLKIRALEARKDIIGIADDVSRRLVGLVMAGDLSEDILIQLLRPSAERIVRMKHAGG